MRITIIGELETAQNGCILDGGSTNAVNGNEMNLNTHLQE